MRVFVTGATGFIGQAVVLELVRAKHSVLGLARSDKSAELLASLGASAHRGSLEDLDSLKSGAASADAVLHLGFVHDFDNFEASLRTDRAAIEAIGNALAGTDRPFIISSGCLVLPQGRLATELDAIDTSAGGLYERGRSEELALSFAAKGVRAGVMRLPPCVHGDDDPQFMTILIRTAREKGVSAYIGEGRNRWPATHRLDAARVYRLAMEKGHAGGVYHPVAEEAVALRDIAETIGKQLGLPVVSLTTEQAQVHFGWFSMALMADNPVSSQRTREGLKWEPVEKGLIRDLEEGTYFSR